MTEAEWLGCTDPAPMLELLRRSMPSRKSQDRRLGDCYLDSDYYLPDLGRKIGLFICACLTRGPSNRDVEERLLFQEFERYCDANATWAAVEKTYWALIERQQARIEEEDRKNNSVTSVHWMLPCEYFADPALIRQSAERMVGWNNADGPEAGRRFQCAFLRDIFNPFYPAPLAPSWLSSTVVTLAEGIYQGRAFDGMPILADALQDAGCDNDDILNHCRGEGPHVRGCWVVDLITGRK